MYYLCAVVPIPHIGIILLKYVTVTRAAAITTILSILLIIKTHYLLITSYTTITYMNNVSTLLRISLSQIYNVNLNSL